MKKTTIALCTFLLGSITLCSQDKKDIAYNKAMEAIGLMDEGKIEESRKLLQEAIKLDDKFAYRYEVAYSYYIAQDYKTAIKLLEKEEKCPDVTERYYQLLGNGYDVTGKTKKAFAAYEEGLKKFPNSGMIILEEGNTYWNKKEYEKALPYYEKGIELDPKFAANYYRAALLFCKASTEEVWGMIYGEIFMNLERNSERTAEISKLLYDTYKSEIKLDGDNMNVSFCKNMTIYVDSKDKDMKPKIPFCMIYEPTLTMALVPVMLSKVIDINSLDQVRTSFVEQYYKMGRDTTYPNALFAYQKKVLDAGHMAAYNHWLLMKGDEDAFIKWRDGNKEKWEKFIAWFTENPIELSNKNKFYRLQY